MTHICGQDEACDAECMERALEFKAGRGGGGVETLHNECYAESEWLMNKVRVAEKERDEARAEVTAYMKETGEQRTRIALLESIIESDRKYHNLPGTEQARRLKAAEARLSEVERERDEALIALHEAEDRFKRELESLR